MNNFRGDLSGISAKTATLAGTVEAGAGTEDERVIILVTHMYIMKTILTLFSDTGMLIV